MKNQTLIPAVPLLRVDRNIVHNIDTLFDLYGIAGDNIDDNLLRSIIYYLCFSYQNDLFSYATFDPCHFAKEMGYAPAYLRRKHPKPLFLEDLKQRSKEEQDYHLRQQLPCYDSILENALYSLWKKEALLSYGARFFNNTDKEQVLTAHQNTRMFILRDLQIMKVKSGKTNQRKTVYHIGMDERFLHSLTKYFILSNKETLISLRKSKLDILYLKLLQQREHAIFSSNPRVEFGNFEMLCRWCGVPQKQKDGADMPAKQRKFLVLQALQTIAAKTNLGFEVASKTSRGQRFPYTFCVTFNLNERMLASKKEAEKNDLMCLFDETLHRDLISFYKMSVCSEQNPLLIDQQGGYRKWMYTDVNYDEKKQIYMLTCAKIFGKEKDEQKQRNQRERNFDVFYKKAIKEQHFIVNCYSEVAGAQQLTLL